MANNSINANIKRKQMSAKLIVYSSIVLFFLLLSCQ